ncbi:MAG: winged helix-turn-helix transcriptional regulator [Solirubrobacteraceae bacterium]
MPRVPLPGAAAAPATSTDPPDRPAALTQALERIGDRWKLTIVAALLDGPRRFGEIAEAANPIAPNVLSRRLRELEQAGLVLAVPYCERPARYLYELTAAGDDLAGVLRLLADWGARHAGGEPLRHGSCGTALEARWYCPTCREPADDAGSLEQVFYA